MSLCNTKNKTVVLIASFITVVDNSRSFRLCQFSVIVISFHFSFSVLDLLSLP